MAPLKQKISTIQIVAGLILWVCGTIFYQNMVSVEKNDTSIIARESTGKYEFIQPLLECENTGDTVNKKYIPFEKKLKGEILSYQQKNYPESHLSFYFRDLQNGPWFSNNYQEGFYPASLLKTPILMGYVKWAEWNPGILKEQIKVQKIVEYEQNYSPEKYAEIGKEYSVEELLEIMTLYSDNNASSNLLIHLPTSIAEDVFATLQVPSPKDETAESYKLNVKEYASFFRILFNASYLSNAGSEATLELLSKVKFDRWLTGKLPKGIKVAHKFGERIYTEETPDGGTKKLAQLHDCGIVYYPGNPYLICIMTRGNTLDELSLMTQDISKMIYDTVDETRKKALQK
jgi:beta-lactamase class A